MTTQILPRGVVLIKFFRLISKNNVSLPLKFIGILNYCVDSNRVQEKNVEIKETRQNREIILHLSDNIFNVALSA